MLVEVAVALWVVGSLAYLLHPLFVDDPGALWDSSWWLSDDDESTEPEPTPRAVTDGGRVCQNCGARLDGEYTFCSQCVTAVV